MSRLAIRTRLSVVAAFAATASAVFACARPTTVTLRDPVAMDSLWIEPFYSAVRDSGVLAVLAAPVDTALRLGSLDRIVLVVSTASDAETFLLGPWVCALDRDCSAIAVSMLDGVDVRTLERAVYEIPARFFRTSGSGRLGAIRLLDGKYVSRAVAVLAMRPGVSIVEQNNLGASSGSSLRRYLLLAPIPLSFQSVKAGDGLLQVTPGGTITLTYTQPDGSALVRTQALPD